MPTGLISLRVDAQDRLLNNAHQFHQFELTRAVSRRSCIFTVFAKWKSSTWSTEQVTAISFTFAVAVWWMNLPDASYSCRPILVWNMDFMDMLIHRCRHAHKRRYICTCLHVFIHEHVHTCMHTCKLQTYTCTPPV